VLQVFDQLARNVDAFERCPSNAATGGPGRLRRRLSS
jgi:hypothetical protein